MSMSLNGITLRILDGADRGKVYSDIAVPVTIGREEGNTIQLNDDRVSRYHVKIQIDNSRLVLTDLESTNGTKVNGEEIQLRILRVGDMISLGRSTLLLGTRSEIARRISAMADNNGNQERSVDLEDSEVMMEAALKMSADSNWQATIHELEPPELPENLSPVQTAQLAELFEYFHIRVRKLIATAESNRKATKITLESQQWQYLLDVQMKMAEYIRDISNPGEE